MNITVSPTESSAIAFAERDCVQQLEARLDGVGDRDELLVELARRDLLEQLPVRRHQLSVYARRPQQRLVMLESYDARIIPAGADSRPTSTFPLISESPTPADERPSSSGPWGPGQLGEASLVQNPDQGRPSPVLLA